MLPGVWEAKGGWRFRYPWLAAVVVVVGVGIGAARLAMTRTKCVLRNWMSFVCDIGQRRGSPASNSFETLGDVL